MASESRASRRREVDGRSRASVRGSACVIATAPTWSRASLSSSSLPPERHTCTRAYVGRGSPGARLGARQPDPAACGRRIQPEARRIALRTVRPYRDPQRKDADPLEKCHGHQYQYSQTRGDRGRRHGAVHARTDRRTTARTGAARAGLRPAQRAGCGLASQTAHVDAEFAQAAINTIGASKFVQAPSA